MPPILDDVAAALFDFDGTLVDASDAICTAFNDALRSRGQRPQAQSSIRSMIGRPLRDMFREVGAASSEADLDECVAVYRSVFMPLSVTMSRLLPDVAEGIPVLARRIKLGIVTNRMSDGAWRILRAHRLDRHFSTVVGIERVKNAKPDPEPVLMALKDLGTEPSRAVMVGDTADDVIAGRAAGVTTIGITTGSTSRPELERAGANQVVDRIDEVVSSLSSQG